MHTFLWFHLEVTKAQVLDEPVGNLEGRAVQHLFLITSSFLLLVVMPGATSSILLLVAMPFVASSFLLLVSRTLNHNPPCLSQGAT